MRHGGRERYTVQCLAAPHLTTGWQKTHTHTHTQRNKNKNKKTSQCLTRHGRARTRDGCLQDFDTPLFLPAFTLKIYFKKFSTRVCSVTCNSWFSCSKFSHTETSGLLNSHTNFLSLFGGLMLRWVLKGICGHFHILIETWKSPSQDTSHILWQV